MFESETVHLRPSIKQCLVCGRNLTEKYNKRRMIKRLSGPIYIVSHVQTCKNESCSNHKIKIFPEEELLLAIKGYKYGLDVNKKNIGQTQVTKL